MSESVQLTEKFNSSLLITLSDFYGGQWSMIQEVPEVIQCHILSPCPTLPPMCLYLPVLISEINPTIHQFSIILVIKLLQTPWSPKLTSAVMIHLSNNGCWSPSGLNCFPLSLSIFWFSVSLYLSDISIRFLMSYLDSFSFSSLQRFTQLMFLMFFSLSFLINLEK